MSDKGSSNPDNSEEPEEEEEIPEEPDLGETQTQEEIREEPDEGETQSQEEIREEPDEGETQSQGEIREEASEGSHAQDDEQSEGSSHNQGSTKDINEEDDAEEVKLTEESAREIFERFEKGEPKIIIVGEIGTGKTWMAKEICKVASEKYGEPIWISLDKKHDKRSFVDTVARQFCLRTSADEREEDASENERKERNPVTVDTLLKAVQEKMADKLIEAEKAKKEPKAFVLLVLDGQVDMLHEDQNDKMRVETKIKEKILGVRASTKNVDKLRVLITRRKIEDADIAGGAKKVKLERLSGKVASKLFEEHVLGRIYFFEGYKEIFKALQENEWKPAEILLLAGTLHYFEKENVDELKPAMEAAVGGLEQLLRYTYDRERGNSMIDCFWHSWNFLREHGAVNYNELITSWIMEGCLKHTNQIDKAYVEGHAVLMKLVEYNMLKLQEDNLIVLEGATLKMDEYCRRGYWRTGDPGLASVLKGIGGKGYKEIPPGQVLDGITPADGMMRTLCGYKKEKMISSILIDGSRLCREVHKAFFGKTESLNLLAIFSPRLKSPEELSILKPDKLLVLMLRGSYLLENVDIVEKLTALTVLEISGSRDCKIKLPVNFFNIVTQLRSLDFSGTGIEKLPDSFSDLTELRRLILSGCRNLEELPKLAKFEKLEIIDLSDCTRFKKIQEKSFRSLVNLKVINFSRTQIEKLPIVKTLEKLSRILLQGCTALSGMRMLKNVKSIKVLDLSGATNIKEVMYDGFEGATNLRELDLSETQIQYLPPAIGDLQKLRLKNCKLLRTLPALSEQKRLEELDLSGCTKLESLPNLSDLVKLKTLNLRDTEFYNEELVKSLRGIKGLQILH